MKQVQNPILKGFNPDPSIIRVGDDYYIATSTFEWFGGVQIHHSKDLVNWELVKRPLDRVSQLDLTGVQNSSGVWAPCLSYHNGVFYLIYTIVKARVGIFKDTHNYLVTATDILGDWSEPVYLNCSGFDPSLFHDDDGKKWIVNMSWDHRITNPKFSGIVLQEYDEKEQKLVGEIKNIFKGSELGITEGPHLYRLNGYYYLITAEGGTSSEHAVTLARSKTIDGEYEICPHNPILTSRYNPKNPLQKAGHADIVETQDGEWYMVHLCGRRLRGSGRCILGRETSLQKISWTVDGWIKVENENNEPDIFVDVPDLPEYKKEQKPIRDNFDSDKLDINFQSLRIPLDESICSLTERKGYLRLKGWESIMSHHKQAIVARRQQAFCYTATTCVEFEPTTYKQMAGLIAFYSTENYHYLYITHDEQLGKCVGILTCNKGEYQDSMKDLMSIDGHTKIYLRAQMDYDKLSLFYSLDENEWICVASDLDSSILSDENSTDMGFTGAFIGLCCHDVGGVHNHADFDWFEYQER